MLIVLGGLPGTGKTTVGKMLVAKRSAAYVRIDEIEQALRSTMPQGSDVGPAGYIVAYAVASSNLEVGNHVVVDCVNPVPETRQAWRDVAQRTRKTVLEIELVCSDKIEHRRRIESRAADIVGLSLPTWASVEAHEYVVWAEPRLVLDTAILRPGDVVAAIETKIASRG